jgi:hypothetical protein
MSRLTHSNRLWSDRDQDRTLISAAARSDFGSIGLAQGEAVVDQDSGALFIGDGSTAGGVPASGFAAQGTPTAKTADATLTIAELLTRIVTATSASAVALTLPTGTLTDAGVLGGTLPVGYSFDWSVINLGSSSGAVTMTAGTDHTYVGAAVVAIATSARFRTRRTAANTYVTYRIS